MKKYVKYIISITIVVFIVILLKQIFKADMSSEEIKQYIQSFGSLGPIIYVIMFALVPLTLFPDSVLAIAGGLVFGLVKGYIYTTIGALLGGTLAFYIARFLGRDVIKKTTKHKLDSIEEMINDKGFFIIFLLRLIPLFPFDIISYGAGLTSVKYKDFILATLVGTIPGILVFTNIGAQSTNMSSGSFILSIIALILLFISSILLKNKFLKTPTK